MHPLLHNNSISRLQINGKRVSRKKVANIPSVGNMNAFIQASCIMPQHRGRERGWHLRSLYLTW